MTGAPFADIAVALKTQAGVLAAQAAEVEQVAIAIGLSAGAVGRIVFPTHRQAELIGEAHRIIKALMPVEGTIRTITSSRRLHEL